MKDRICLRCGDMIRGARTNRVRHEECQAAHTREYQRAYSAGYNAAVRFHAPDYQKRMRARQEQRDPEARQRRLDRNAEWKRSTNYNARQRAAYRRRKANA